jgi:hypothetical protein
VAIKPAMEGGKGAVREEIEVRMVMDFGGNGYTWWNGCIVLIFGVRERRTT